MNYFKEYGIIVSIEKNWVTKEYLVTYFSLLNNKIILWLSKWKKTIFLNKDNKVFKNLKELKF